MGRGNESGRHGVKRHFSDHTLHFAIALFASHGERDLPEKLSYSPAQPMELPTIA
jgi:hypothetical protein